MPDNDQTTQSPGTTDGAGATPGTTDKMVPERDLLAVKRGSEKLVTDHKAAMDAAKVETDRQFAEEHSTRLNLEAEIEKAKTSTEHVPAEKFRELETQHATTKGELETANTKILEAKKVSIAATYKLKPEDLATKTDVQLDSLVEALMLTRGASGSTYDSGTGGGGQPLTGRAVELSEVAEARARQPSNPNTL